MGWRDKGVLMAKLSALMSMMSLMPDRRDLRAMGIVGKHRKTTSPARARRKKISRRRRVLANASKRGNMRDSRGLRRAA